MTGKKVRKRTVAGRIFGIILIMLFIIIGAVAILVGYLSIREYNPPSIETIELDGPGEKDRETGGYTDDSYDEHRLCGSG